MHDPSPARALQPLRLASAILIGLLSAGLTYWSRPSINNLWVDIAWSINAARSLMAHIDPYSVPVDFGTIPYPLTAVVLVFPFALLPGALGVVLLTGLAFGLVAYGLTEGGRYWRLLLIASPAYLTTIYTGQWSPIFIAAMFFPALLPVVLAKPTLALPVLFARWPRWGPVIAAAAVGLISLLIMPDWPWRWLGQTHDYNGFIPLLTPLGPALALSLVAWRSPSARLLLLMSLTPQHRLFYDQLFLWLVPQSPRQMLALTFPSWIAFFYVKIVFGNFLASGPYILAGVYLPALLIVLWQERARFAALANRLGIPIRYSQQE